MRIIDLTGKQFNRLTVTNTYEVRAKRKYWLCDCVCGNKVFVQCSKLLNGHTKSCGCLQKDRCVETNTYHGQVNTPGYRAYQNMIKRCYYTKGDKYKYYGGRGITVEPLWLGSNGFINFISDMGQPLEGTSLDRIDVNGPYSKHNCRWASKTQQMRNTRSNHLIDLGQGSKCLTEICEELSIKPGNVQNIVRRKGMTYEEAINYLK